MFIQNIQFLQLGKANAYLEVLPMKITYLKNPTMYFNWHASKQCYATQWAKSSSFTDLAEAALPLIYRIFLFIGFHEAT